MTHRIALFALLACACAQPLIPQQPAACHGDLLVCPRQPPGFDWTGLEPSFAGFSCGAPEPVCDGPFKPGGFVVHTGVVPRLCTDGAPVCADGSPVVCYIGPVPGGPLDPCYPCEAEDAAARWEACR